MPSVHNAFQDITDICNSQTLLLAMLNTAVDGIIVICEKNLVRLFNAGAENLFGYSAQEVVGRNASLLLPSLESDRQTDSVGLFPETGESNIIGGGRQVQAVSKSGEVFPVNVSLSRFETGGRTMFVAIARDIRMQTNLQTKLDQERRKTQKLQCDLNKVNSSSTLTELVSSIAHEMNQPLAAIANYAAVSRRALESESPGAEHLGQMMSKISHQAVRASEVIKRIRALAHKTELPRQHTCVNLLISEFMPIVNSEAQEENCRVRWFIDKNLPVVLACPAQIQHVLLLLLRNSLESMSGVRQEPKELQIWVKHVHPCVELSIKDRGHGVNAELVDRMYYPFTTDKIGSLGIGLSICSTIVRNHGGDIWHKPNPLGGSRFYFTLPVHSQEDQNHENS